MICPYCGEEMESGYLMANRGIQWRLEVDGAGCLRKEDGEFLLGKFNLWKTPAFPANLCRGCQKFIMDVPKKK